MAVFYNHRPEISLQKVKIYSAKISRAYNCKTGFALEFEYNKNTDKNTDKKTLATIFLIPHKAKNLLSQLSCEEDSLIGKDVQIITQTNQLKTVIDVFFY